MELIEPEPTGKLIGLQIKTGSSHFEERPDGFVYYGSMVHLDYWLGHSLPVLLIAHFPNSRETLWAHVTEANVTRTSKGWKIEIPKTSKFGKEARQDLLAIFHRRDPDWDIDALTRIPSRAYLRDRLPVEMRRARAEQRHISVAFVDVDGFKSVNDTFGYEVGDLVLQRLAVLLRSAVRQNGWIARSGGDEFVIVFTNASLERALELAENVRRRIGATKVETPAGKIKLTVSFGVAEFYSTLEAAESSETILTRADQALYAAKKAGKNRVRA